ncbi:EpsG family protein [Aestuariivivens marinum]|uniref:EpsG family protein n=1 Tax=Aestuariivivens marinum TaxID=2913555 RepID=UPI001F580998|nr:EpsG family protein [Aestuariivivens marinum]
MVLAYCIYIILLVLSYTSASHNYKLLTISNQNIQSIEKNNVYWRWPLFIAFFSIIFIVGFRYDVGVDYMGYYRDFYGLGWAHHWEGKISRYEFGYEAILRTLIYFNFKVWTLFTIIAVFIWYFFIQSFKIFPFLLKWGLFFAFTTGFFFASMNGMRQTIALAIFMYTIKYIEKESLTKYVVYIILASSFHTSILLVLPFYFFINKISFTNQRWLIIYIITYIVGNKLDIKDVILFGLDLFPKYQHYTDRFLEDFSNPISGGFGNFYLFFVGFVIILLSKDLIKKAPKLKIYYNLFFIGAIMFNFFWKYDILGRIYYLFIWFKIFCMAALVYYLGKSKNSWLIYLLIITQLTMFIYKIYKGENLCSPFQFEFMA